MDACRRSAARVADAKGDEVINRVEYDEDGQIDEAVTDAGMHLERMSEKGWFICGHRSDGSSIAIWFKGKITLVEERPVNE